MTEQDFNECVNKYSQLISEMRKEAHQLHADVNQTYDKVHPYGYHLDMVAGAVQKYGFLVCAVEDDVVPLFFGAYYHDAMEDARQTYNDIRRLACHFMSEDQAYMATEIVYALTNDKGRTRAERAGEKYYQGIRETPYAPFVKLADRLANITYSFSHASKGNVHMKEVYQSELPHFLSAISVDGSDGRFYLPQPMLEEIKTIVCV